MKMYRVGYVGHGIEELEVIRETASCVFFASGRNAERETREAKPDRWFSTWDDAHAFILKTANDRVASTLEKLGRDIADVKKIKSMTAGVRK